jgi:hypothetical protein
MPTPEEKFRKLLAAYEDEIQRKQHKMGRKVEPTDEPQLNAASGYCTFLRHGQQVVWSPSFDVIGTFDTATLSWTWGWADQTIELKIRSRMDAVRKQGGDWGIDLLTNGLLTLGSEQQAWELATVATAVSGADAMYRLIEQRDVGQRQRFLALFDGPPPSRSQSLRAAIPRSDSQPIIVKMPSTANMQAVNPASPISVRSKTPYPGVASPSAFPVSPSSTTGSNRPSVAPPSASSVVPRIAPSAAPPSDPHGAEPTEVSRNEIGLRIFEIMTTSQQGELGTAQLVARAVPPMGPVGAISIESRLVLRPRNGPEQTLVASPALEDALVGLWNRTRERNGFPFKFATARLESSPQGLVTHLFLEF